MRINAFDKFLNLIM